MRLSGSVVFLACSEFADLKFFVDGLTLCFLYEFLF